MKTILCTESLTWCVDPAEVYAFARSVVDQLIKTAQTQPVIVVDDDEDGVMLDAVLDSGAPIAMVDANRLPPGVKLPKTGGEAVVCPLLK